MATPNLTSSNLCARYARVHTSTSHAFVAMHVCSCHSDERYTVRFFHFHQQFSITCTVRALVVNGPKYACWGRGAGVLEERASLCQFLLSLVIKLLPYFPGDRTDISLHSTRGFFLEVLSKPPTCIAGRLRWTLGLPGQSHSPLGSSRHHQLWAYWLHYGQETKCVHPRLSLPSLDGECYPQEHV